MSLSPFHLALPVDDLQKAERFYGEVMGCAQGRRSERWIDFNFFGHQLVTHLAPAECGKAVTGDVDGKQVPVKHFGVLLDPAEWEMLAERLKAADAEFIIEPCVRFEGQPSEQRTFFLLDPAGNALEFKAFNDNERIFAVD